MRVMRKSILLLLILTSCNEVWEEHTEPLQLSRSNSSVSIINSAPNTTLYINDCNIGEADGKLSYRDTLTFKSNVSSDTIILDGELWSSYLIYDGDIYIPYSNIIELKNGCNWYDSNENKILRAISFSVEVDDWQQQNK